MAIETSRVSTQPACPPGVRMRLQPSVRGASFCGGTCSASAAASSRSVLESSSQSGGSAGGFGIGGILDDFLVSFGGNFGFFGAGGINGFRGASERGSTNDCSTSNFSFSLSCRKLGEEITGCV